MFILALFLPLLSNVLARPALYSSATYGGSLHTSPNARSRELASMGFQSSAVDVCLGLPRALMAIPIPHVVGAHEGASPYFVTYNVGMLCWKGVLHICQGGKRTTPAEHALASKCAVARAGAVSAEVEMAERLPTL